MIIIRCLFSSFIYKMSEKQRRLWIWTSLYSYCFVESLWCSCSNWCHSFVSATSDPPPAPPPPPSAWTAPSPSPLLVSVRTYKTWPDRQHAVHLLSWQFSYPGYHFLLTHTPLHHLGVLKSKFNRKVDLICKGKYGKMLQLLKWMRVDRFKNKCWLKNETHIASCIWPLRWNVMSMLLSCCWPCNTATSAWRRSIWASSTFTSSIFSLLIISSILKNKHWLTTQREKKHFYVSMCEEGNTAYIS